MHKAWIVPWITIHRISRYPVRCHGEYRSARVTKTFLSSNIAENEEPGSGKRARKPNFTAAECTVILESAEENIDIIKSKFSSTLTNKNKIKIWEQITDRVNSLGICKRSVMEVKEKWRGMVSNAKKEHNNIRSEKKKTGGGKKPDSPKRDSIKIIQLFGEDPSFSGISGGIESGKLFDKLISLLFATFLFRVYKFSQGSIQ